MKLLIFLALTIGMIGFASCEKVEVERAVAFEDLQMTTLCTPADESLSEETFIISSKEEYDARTSCIVGAPEIDFSKRYVMGGWKLVEGCAVLDEQSLQIRKTTLHYQVDMLRGDCDTPTMVYYMVSLPIGYRKYETEFHVNVR